MGWWNYFLIFFATVIILTSIGGGGSVLGFVALMSLLIGGGFFLARQFGVLNHPNAFINYLHARSFLGQGKIPQALEHYDKALQMNPNLDVARREKEALLLMLNNPNLTPNHHPDPFNTTPNEKQLFDMRVKALMNQKDYEGVLQEAETFLNSHPDYQKAIYFRAQAYHQLENLEQAAQDYELYIQHVPNQLDAYANLAEVYIQLRQPERAKAHYDNALNRDSRFSAARAGRAFLLGMQGDYQAALADAEYAIELDTNKGIAHPGPYYSRGCIYALMGDEQAAFDDLQYALDLKPDYHYAIAAMAVVHQLRNHRLQADAMWKTLIRQDARYTDIQWVLNRYGWQGTLEQSARELVQRMAL
jgi:tetratricopeptide (TPR) repeat protein